MHDFDGINPCISRFYTLFLYVLSQTFVSEHYHFKIT